MDQLDEDYDYRFDLDHVRMSSQIGISCKHLQRTG